MRLPAFRTLDIRAGLRASGLRLPGPRARRRAGIAGLALALPATIVGAQLGATLGAWTDTEWVSGTTAGGTAPGVGALQCGVSQVFTDHGTARVLAGSVGSPSVSLDPLAALAPLTSTATPAGTTHSIPVTALGGGAVKSLITASALNAVQASVGVTVPLTNSGVGAYTQWTKVKADGTSSAAAGAVTDTGAVDTGAGGSTPPSTGTVSVPDLPALTSTSLTVGALTGRASLDACPGTWAHRAPTASELTRDYDLASLGLATTSPAAAAVLGPTSVVWSDYTAASTTLAGLIGTDSTTGTAEASVQASALAGVSAAVTGITGSTLGTATLGLGTTSATAKITLTLPDAAGLQATAQALYHGGAVDFDPSTGRLTIDAAQLLALDGQAANTRVLTPAMLQAVTTAVVNELASRSTALKATLDAALPTASVMIDVDVPVTATATVATTPVTLPIIDVTAHWSFTLAQALASSAPAPTITVTALPLGALSTVIGALVPALVTSLQTGLVAPLGTLTGTLGTALDTQLGVPMRAALATVETAASAAATALTGTLNTAFVALGALLDVRVNAQPDQSGGVGYATSLTAGQYAVSALYIGVLPSGSVPASAAAKLWFGTAVVGANGL